MRRDSSQDDGSVEGRPREKLMVDSTRKGSIQKSNMDDALNLEIVRGSIASIHRQESPTKEDGERLMSN